MVSAVEWTDADGRGVAVATEERDAKANRVLLHVYSFKLPASSAPVLLWEMNDGVATCASDNTTAFMKPALETSDVDHDGLVEVMVAYRVECASGMAPQTHRVLLYEGGSRYALQGAILRASTPRLPGYTKAGKAQHSLKADPSFDAAPKEIREAMRERWDAVVKGDRR